MARYDRYGQAVVAEAILPLARTMICPDEHIFDVSYRACPVCLSEHILPLATWLGSTGRRTS